MAGPFSRSWPSRPHAQRVDRGAQRPHVGDLDGRLRAASDRAGRCIVRVQRVLCKCFFALPARIGESPPPARPGAHLRRAAGRPARTFSSARRQARVVAVAAGRATPRPPRRRALCQAAGACLPARRDGLHALDDAEPGVLDQCATSASSDGKFVTLRQGCRQRPAARNTSRPTRPPAAAPGAARPARRPRPATVHSTPRLQTASNAPSAKGRRSRRAAPPGGRTAAARGQRGRLGSAQHRPDPGSAASQPAGPPTPAPMSSSRVPGPQLHALAQPVQRRRGCRCPGSRRDRVSGPSSAHGVLGPVGQALELRRPSVLLASGRVMQLSRIRSAHFGLDLGRAYEVALGPRPARIG